MIINTNSGNSYIVKFRKLERYFEEKSIDNYGRFHKCIWKEPIIICTVKEHKPFITDAFGCWTGTSWCRYMDNFDEKFGYEFSLEKALNISSLSDEEKKSITKEVMAQKKIHQKVVKPYMTTVDGNQFLREFGCL